VNLKVSRYVPFVFICYLFGCTNEVTVDYKTGESDSGVQLFERGNVSTHLYERDMAISNSGNELVYSVSDIKQQRRCLVSLQKTDGQWGEKKILPFSGSHQDIEPFFFKSTLFFASNRPIDEGDSTSDYNLFMVAQNEFGQYTKPEYINASLNTEGDEFYPSLSTNGNLYFTATRADGIGREDIFIAISSDSGYSEPVALDTNINTRSYEFNAFISPAEDLLVFSSFGRKDGLGGGDLYYSKKDENGNWEPAQNLGDQINSNALDYCPFIDYNEGYFYFTSERADSLNEKIRTVEEIDRYFHQPLNGLGNIYRVRLSEMPWKK